LPVYGDGLNIRDWLYVGDHCSAIRRVLEAGGLVDPYQVGGYAERVNRTVVKTICALLDARRPLADGRARESLITFVKDRPGHDRRYAIDASKGLPAGACVQATALLNPSPSGRGAGVRVRRD
jgi:dTDP-glucose 4,6-dehydratase